MGGGLSVKRGQCGQWDDGVHWENSVQCAFGFKLSSSWLLFPDSANPEPSLDIITGSFNK